MCFTGDPVGMSALQGMSLNLDYSISSRPGQLCESQKESVFSLLAMSPRKAKHLHPPELWPEMGRFWEETLFTGSPVTPISPQIWKQFRSWLHFMLTDTTH